MTDLPEFPRWVSVRDPNTNQRWKPAVARLRDGTLIVWAQVGRVVERVVELPNVAVGSKNLVVSEVIAEDGQVWQIEKAACGCGAKALKAFDPDRSDP